jgi:hypothetical protein
MKVLFLIALLANITFFFWHVNYGTLNTQAEKSSADINEHKQILLVDELSKKTEEKKKKTPELNNSSVQSKNIEIGQNEARKPENTNQESDIIISSSQPDKTIAISWWENLDTLYNNSQIIYQVGDDINGYTASNIEAMSKNQPELNTYCYQVGAFEKLDALEAWRKTNNIEPILLRKVNKKTKNVTSFMVYYPAAENLEESNKNIQILVDKGIDDYWLFSQDERKGMISLGKFASEKRALLLQQKLIKKGLNVKIMQRLEIESEFYAQITTENKALKDSLKISEKLALSECDSNRSEYAVSNSMDSLLGS